MNRSNAMLTAVFGLAASGLWGCDRSPAAPEEVTMLDRALEATSSFAAPAAGIAAGYAADDHCVAHPDLGGMGHHYIAADLVDPTFDPSRPEVLLYAADAGGALRLVGVEYIVIDVGQSRPAFDGHPFDIGGVPPLEAEGVPHYSLHVWTHEENPSGVFTPFNPQVSC